MSARARIAARAFRRHGRRVAALRARAAELLEAAELRAGSEAETRAQRWGVWYLGVLIACLFGCLLVRLSFWLAGWLAGCCFLLVWFGWIICSLACCPERCRLLVASCQYSEAAVLRQLDLRRSRLEAREPFAARAQPGAEGRPSGGRAATAAAAQLQ